MAGVTDIPARLLTPEQREERIAELRRAQAREWVRYAVLEALLIFAPAVLFFVWWVRADASETTLYVGMGIAIGAMILFFSLWMARRIMPIARQLRELGVSAFPDDD